MKTIVWLHNDFRLLDNPALFHAVEAGTAIPAFVWAPDEEGSWSPGGAHRWWLHHSLYSLASDLESKGSALVIRKGSSSEAIHALVEETGAERVVWNSRFEPALRERDRKISRSLKEKEIEVVQYQSRILHDPDRVRTTNDTPYKVFSPFWRKFLKVVDISESLPMPRFAEASLPQIESMSIDDLALLPKVDWAGGLRESWTPGEAGAHEALDSFVDESISSYDQNRNFPHREGTSRLSPHLRFGEIGPRQVWNLVRARAKDGDGRENFLREIGWREFSYHLLHHFPRTTTQPLDERFNEFPWVDSDEDLRRWQKGQTGYPIVDAGMRQLWHTGWMHNRVRMIVASFLTKDLLLHWIEGARWFWDTLVDGDLANNTQGWQWAAGSGADAQPFFRIFNPVSQGERFDPDGQYVRHWVPELSKLPNKYLHCPWETPEEVLSEAGLELGVDYPEPIVDHSEARKKALDAFEKVK
ncbi:MAG: deoxyribodipyrimidine photo-lyase [Rhodothermales bacterium]|nr:deoxyribodipyrimidine photo-lyase [Rhodothermales bacterium]